jgi:iron complex outermembrane receptor protein
MNAGGGIEVPAGNETDPAGTFGDDTVTALNPLLEPIRSATYELGTKHLLGDGTGLVHGVMYDAALYTTDVTNEIVPYSGGRFYFTAGRVRRSGAELGLSVQLSRGFFAQTALAASRNVYRHYVVDSVHYKRPGAFADLSGNRVVGLPARTYSATAGWSTDRLAGLRVEAGTRGQSDYFADDANRVNVPSFSTLNARLSLARGIPLGERVALRGFVSVDNLADRRYIESSFLNPDYVSGVPVAFEPGLPRNVVISASLGWR